MGSFNRRDARRRRHLRVRKRVLGTPERPRLSVYRSLKHMHCQIIDDVAGKTLVAASTLELKDLENGGNVEAAKAVGELIARRAKEKGITEVVFDRGGDIYHGRVAAVAEGARAEGLEF